ncbi:toxin-antitoxin system YwqK family antitoxin [Flavobacterium sedimenticola]|uniref:Uncharacterized protein n=1 Tax=Flavobacterium sedimenticola TaxID=3043286 RepID=A0ABT6XNB8_9FLAO|nr:hypothetical protein [Flavobacterium sedimenticola]MDI9256477.1 hypothetical protein [Flavobacterium sedimenticola]
MLMNQKRLIFGILVLFVMLLQSCKINKTINHHREGKWVYKDTVNGIRYKSKGRYRKSIETRTWRYYENRKLVKTEQYQNGICNIKTFDNRGRISSTGQSIMVEEADGTHWYIVGDWTFFDAKGQVIGIKKYDKGELLSETEVQVISNP